LKRTNNGEYNHIFYCLAENQLLKQQLEKLGMPINKNLIIRLRDFFLKLKISTVWMSAKKMVAKLKVF
jgi:hypothetical protein